MLVGRQNEALDPVILPWEAVHSKVTHECYRRRSSQFLVFAGYMDPTLWSHKNPTKAAAEAEGRETLIPLPFKMPQLPSLIARFSKTRHDPKLG